MEEAAERRSSRSRGTNYALLEEEVQDDDDKHAQWTPLPYRFAGYVTAGLIGSLLLVCGAYFSLRGWKAYRDVAAPHRALVASSKDIRAGAPVVKPFFGPEKLGGIVEHVQLQATIWFKNGSAPNSPPRWWEPVVNGETVPLDFKTQNDWYIGGITPDSAWEEYGLYHDQSQNSTPWEMLSTLTLSPFKITETKQETHQVRLPGHINYTLVTNPFSRLVATFALLPANRYSLTFGDSSTLDHETVRVSKLYGRNFTWPMSRPPNNSPSSPLESFITDSGIGYDIKYTYHTTPEWEQARLHATTPAEIVPEPQRADWEIIDRISDPFRIFIPTRSWIVSASEFSTLKLDTFKEGMEIIKSSKGECMNGTFFWDHTCNRLYIRYGSMENLLTVTEASKKPEHRYGPYLTTMLSTAMPREYLQLPKFSAMRNLSVSEVEDLVFDWHITYSAVSPAKLSLAKKVTGWDAYRHFSPMWPGHETAHNSDWLELANAMLGHQINPQGYPITRAILNLLATALQWLNALCEQTPWDPTEYALTIVGRFIGLYWFTRRTTAGIAIGTLTAQSGFELSFFWAQTALSPEEIRFFYFTLTTLAWSALLFRQVFLWLRLEIKFQKGVPVAVRRRGTKLQERESRAHREKFDWRYQILLLVFTFAILRIVPTPPAIVDTVNFEESEIMRKRLDHRNWEWQDPWSQALTWHQRLDALRSATWLVSRVAQILLNHRNRTFGGFYAINAYLTFTALLLSRASTILVHILGRAEYMRSFTGWDAFTLIVEAGVVYQAWSLKGVKQISGESGQ